MAALTEEQKARIEANKAEALRRKAALAQIASVGQERFTFGKHAARTFGEAAGNDAGYCSWAQAQQGASGQLGRFVEYLARLKSHSTGQPGQKRSCDGTDDIAAKRQRVQEIARPTAQRRIPLRLQHQYLEHIKAGRKRWEGRLNVGAPAGASKGCLAVFSSGRDNLEMTVQSVRKYGSFEDMLQDLGVETCLPGVTSVARGVSIYHGFPGFAEKEKQFGVVAMELAPP